MKDDAGFGPSKSNLAISVLFIREMTLVMPWEKGFGPLKSQPAIFTLIVKKMALGMPWEKGLDLPNLDLQYQR